MILIAILITLKPNINLFKVFIRQRILKKNQSHSFKPYQSKYMNIKVLNIINRQLPSPM